MGATSDSSKPAAPPAVEEAEDTLWNYRIRLSLGWFGAVTACLVGGTQWLGFYGSEILPYLAGPTAAVAGLLVYPLGGNAGLARRVIRRWNEIRTEKVLQPPPQADPRVRAAIMLADRIGEDPAGADVAEIADRLVRQLSSAVADLAAVEATTRTKTPPPAAAADSRTDLEVRIARLLSGLAELHGALMLRGSGDVAVEMKELRELLAQLHAEAEVEALLGRISPGSL
jgi:hypothetical protein